MLKLFMIGSQNQKSIYDTTTTTTPTLHLVTIQRVVLVPRWNASSQSDEYYCYHEGSTGSTPNLTDREQSENEGARRDALVCFPTSRYNRLLEKKDEEESSSSNSSTYLKCITTQWPQIYVSGMFSKATHPQTSLSFPNIVIASGP